MNKDIIDLKNEFLKIKKMRFVKALRKGCTGIGYTFESLINKEEDCLCKPDFNSVEIKCRYGYSKSAMTLFTCIPVRDESEFSAVFYIFERYSYHRYNNENDYKLFSRNVFANYAMEINDYSFSLFIDYESQKIIMQAFQSGSYIEDVCYWSFNVLKEKLYTKLRYLAIILGYPYKINGDTYYLYTNMNAYKFRGFNTFLRLIEEKKIYIQIYLKESHSTGNRCPFENHGVAFRIKYENIEDLFSRIYL